MKYLKYQDINSLLWYSLKTLSTGHYTQLHLCSYLATHTAARNYTEVLQTLHASSLEHNVSEAESQVGVRAHPSGCTCSFQSISLKSSRV